MAELKTKKTEASVSQFIENVEHPKRKEDAKVLNKLMIEITGEKPKMWGPSIIGYGSYHYKYASGQEGDWMTVGFSPRKASLSLYIMSGFTKYTHLLAKLGKFKTGKSCLYINKLEDVDMEVLKEIIQESVNAVKAGEIRYE